MNRMAAPVLAFLLCAPLMSGQGAGQGSADLAEGRRALRGLVREIPEPPAPDSQEDSQADKDRVNWLCGNIFEFEAPLGEFLRKWPEVAAEELENERSGFATAILMQIRDVSSPRLKQAVIARSKSNSSWVRFCACVALGDSSGPDVTAALRSRLRDEYAMVRWGAVGALSAVAPKDGWRIWGEAICDRSSSLRMQVASIMVRKDQHRTERIARELRKSRKRYSREAVATLEEVLKIVKNPPRLSG